MNPKYRQEVLNVVLAQLLRERGVLSEPENILRVAGEEERSMPDVIVDFCGLRMVIEGEVDDQPLASDKVIHAARRRVEQGIAHISIGVIYPSVLRGMEFENLKGQLADSILQIAVVTEAEEASFSTGRIDDLENALRRAYEGLLEENIVEKAAAILDSAAEHFMGLAVTKPGWVGRMAEILEIEPLPRRGKAEVEEEPE